MFTISDERKFSHKVRVQVPATNGWREETFTATFRVLSTEEVAPFDLTSAEGTTDFLRATVVGLDELQDDDKKPLSYSDELRNRLILIPFVRNALVRTYVEAVTKAKSGN